MCADINATDPQVLKKRMRLREEIFTALENRVNGYSRQRAELLIHHRTATYPQGPHGALQTALCGPRTLLAGIYGHQRDWKEAVCFILLAFESIGYAIEGAGVDASVEGPLVVTKWGLFMDGIVVAWLILRNALSEIAPERAVQANPYARMAYLISVGEDTNLDAIGGQHFDVVEAWDSRERISSQAACFTAGGCTYKKRKNE